MKILVAIVVLVLLALLIFIFPPLESRVDHRAWLTNSKVALREADTELHKFGAFTNYYSQYITVHSYTNRFIVDGTNYQCELAAECERLKYRGFLTITTNQIFIWVDKKGGLTPLVAPRFEPAGF